VRAIRCPLIILAQACELMKYSVLSLSLRRLSYWPGCFGRWEASCFHRPATGLVSACLASHREHTVGVSESYAHGGMRDTF
jgi:hypothetical protein